MRIGLTGRSSTLLLGFVLGVLTGFAAAGWLLPVGGAAAGMASRRADWQPSPVPKDWEAPVLGRVGGTPTLGPTTAATRPAGTATPAPAGATSTGSTSTGPTPTGPARTMTPPAATPSASGATTPAVGATSTAGGATAARPAGTPAPTSTPAPQVAGRGEWHEEHVDSRALGRRMPFLIWVPPGYSASRRYPVAYMLHGGGDGQTPGRAEWLQFGMREALDQAQAAGELPPAIFVFPEGLDGYWVNHANGGPRWADYVVQDVVAHVDRVWSTETRPEKRAIGGLSMGGHAALHLALNNPETFRIAGAHSPALRSHKDSPPFFGDEAYWARFDPLTLATRGRVATGLRAWLDVGEQDRWRNETQQVAAALERSGARTELKMFPGRHEGEYWKAHLRDYVRYYGEALRG